MPKAEVMPWVQITVQKVLRDEETYEILNVFPKWEQFSIPLYKLMKITLPVKTKSSKEMNGEELVTGIYALVIQLLQERYGGTVNERQDLIL